MQQRKQLRPRRLLKNSFDKKAKDEFFVERRQKGGWSDFSWKVIPGLLSIE